MRLRILTAAILLVMASISIGFCQDQEIVGTVNSFYDSVEKGDKVALINLMTNEAADAVRKNSSKAGNLGNVYELCEKIRAGLLAITFKERKITILKKSADSAQVEARSIFKADYIKERKSSEDKTVDVLNLKLQNKKWLIEDITSND
ncbi:MAG: hypothetical protein LWY06_08390 [Firmicutes bacterium]|nr:hypothetical protein [Bacillota bacterium]